jgi:hypothetical protein
MTRNALAQRIDLQRARDVEPVAAHVGDAVRGVDQHRPQRTDEDDEDRRGRRVLDGVERERHPRQRRDRFQHLHVGIDRLVEHARVADHEAERNRHRRRQGRNRPAPGQRMRELDADALVVGAVVVERIGQLAPTASGHRRRGGEARRRGWPAAAHQRGVFGIDIRRQRWVSGSVASCQTSRITPNISQRQQGGLLAGLRVAFMSV